MNPNLCLNAKKVRKLLSFFSDNIGSNTSLKKKTVFNISILILTYADGKFLKEIINTFHNFRILSG